MCVVCAGLVVNVDLLQFNDKILQKTGVKVHLRADIEMHQDRFTGGIYGSWGLVVGLQLDERCYSGDELAPRSRDPRTAAVVSSGCAPFAWQLRSQINQGSDQRWW